MSAPASALICWYAANGGTHCLGSVRGGFGVTCPSRGVGAACCKACDKAAVKQPGLFTALQFSLCRGQHGRFFVFHGVSMGGSLCFHGGFWDESCVLLLVFCSWCMLMVGSAKQVAADSRLVQLCGCRPVFIHNPASMLLVSMWAAQHGICSLTRP
jgi:hypothetical protein